MKHWGGDMITHFFALRSGTFYGIPGGGSFQSP